jgi:hypothetical protein
VSVWSDAAVRSLWPQNFRQRLARGRVMQTPDVDACKTSLSRLPNCATMIV